MKRKWNLIIFIILEIILYSCIIYNVLSNKIDVNIDCIIRYIATFIYCLFSLLFSSFLNRKNRPILLSTIFIIFADYFLLFSTKYEFIGLICFFFVQTLYNFYLTSNYKKTLIICATSLLISLVSLIFYKILLIDFIYIYVGISYGLMSVINFIYSIIKIIKTKDLKMLYFTISILLLLCCDLCIGLFAIKHKNIFNDLEWIFYLPSLVLMYFVIFNNEKSFLDKEKAYE